MGVPNQEDLLQKEEANPSCEYFRRDFLLDNNINIMFGVGIHGMVRKIEEEYGLKIFWP